MIRNHIIKPIIIIGMHRSGTTMLANALNQAGINMGVVRDHNGEAMHFLSLNQQMLWAENASWLDPKVPSAQNNKTIAYHDIYAEHLKLLSANRLRLRLLNNIPWGWKDPRNTFTLVHWLSVFPKAKVIHVVRDGRDVALSLNVRNSVDGEVYDPRLDDLNFDFKLWETYVQEGLRWEEKLGKQILRVRYEDLIELKPVTLKRVDAFTNKKVSKFLTPFSQKEKVYPDQLNKIAAESLLFSTLGYRIN